MSDEKRSDERSVLADVPDELRPFARAPANPIVQPGDDPHLDAAVATLRDLHGGEDPLFYDVKEDGSPGEPRGIGNARVYVPPVRPAGARGERRRARKRAAAIGVVAGLVMGVGLLLVVNRGAEPPGREATAPAGATTSREAPAAPPRGTAAVERAAEEAVAAMAAMADSGAVTMQDAARSEGPVGSAGNASAPRRLERGSTAPRSAAPPAAPERNQGAVAPKPAPEPAPMPPAAPPAPTSKRLFGAES